MIDCDQRYVQARKDGLDTFLGDVMDGGVEVFLSLCSKFKREMTCVGLTTLKNKTGKKPVVGRRALRLYIFLNKVNVRNLKTSHQKRV